MHHPGQPLLSRNRENFISKDTSKIHPLTVQPSQKLLWTTYLREQMQYIFSFHIFKVMIENETMQATLSSLRKTTWVFLDDFPLKAMSQPASWRAPCQTKQYHTKKIDGKLTLRAWTLKILKPDAWGYLTTTIVYIDENPPCIRLSHEILTKDSI